MEDEEHKEAEGEHAPENPKHEVDVSKLAFFEED